MATTTTTTSSIINRRNATAKSYRLPSTTTTTTSLLSSSPTYDTSSDFKLVPIEPTSYTSLQDILPTPTSDIMSPKSPYPIAYSGYEILIRDPLVKHAAWAYLKPMSTSPLPNGPTFFRRMWDQLSDTLYLITTLFDCVISHT